SSINNHFLIPAVDRFRKVFVNWIAKNHKPKKATLMPSRPTLFCFPNVPSTLKVNGNGVNSKARSSKNGDVRTSGDIPSAPINGVNQYPVAMFQPSVIDAVASGKVNESFDDADMNNTKSSGKSKSGADIITPNSSKEPSDIKRAITLDLRNSSTRTRSPGSVADRGGLSDFTERRRISRKYQSTVSRTSIFVNMRLRHYSVVQPPLNMLDLFRVVRRNSTTRARVLFLLLICTMIISITMVFPAALFKLLEPEWTYLDALYFCFISLSTIGFGDLVPGRVFLGYNSSTTDPTYNSLHETYLVTSAVYLITGATLMMLMVRTYRSMMELERKAKRDRLYTKLQHSFTDPASLNRSAPHLMMGRN
ncbi:unnamed protein product, partial [Hymenolepis diminuta]